MSQEPIDLQALFSEICPEAGELILPGPGQALAQVRPGSIESTASVIRCLRQAMLPWTIGPLDSTVEPRRPVVIIDVSRLTRVDNVHPRSGLVTVDGGVRTETLARLLRGEGYHTDPLPRRVLLGRALASRWGRLRYPGSSEPSLVDRVISLSAILPDGSLLRTPLAPRRATGPDLAALLLGSHGMLGVIVSVTLRAQQLPRQSSELGLLFAGEEQAHRAEALLRQADLPLAALACAGCTVALRLQGMEAMVQAARKCIGRLLGSLGPQPRAVDGKLLEPRPPQLEPPSAEVAQLTQRLRKSLDPAELLLTWDELQG